MNRTYLIQRLEKPLNPPEGHLLHGKDNPFVFGGGLNNGGLSKEAMEMLRPIFSFDYMGAAEFEFGEVPKALSKIAQGAQDLVRGEVRVPNEKMSMMAWEKRMFQPLPKDGEVIVYILCRKEHLEYVQELVRDLIASKVLLKEDTLLRESVMTRKDGDMFNKRICGWLELDNGFFFFTDKEMFEKTTALLMQ